METRQGEGSRQDLASYPVVPNNCFYLNQKSHVLQPVEV